MPTSQHFQISKIVTLISILNPKSVLDIGVGFGKYGVLCREYLELEDGREEYNKFTRKIDGIEAFEEYLTPLHKYIYDTIYIGDAKEKIKELKEKYDVVLLIDVLEHFTKKEGKELLNILLKQNKGVLIAIPKYIGDQKDSFHNPYEEHKGQWSKRELKKQAKYHYFVSDALSHIVYLSNKNKVDKLRKTYTIIKIKREIMHIPFSIPIYEYLKKLIL